MNTADSDTELTLDGLHTAEGVLLTAASVRRLPRDPQEQLARLFSSEEALTASNRSYSNAIFVPSVEATAHQPAENLSLNAMDTAHPLTVADLNNLISAEKAKALVQSGQLEQEELDSSTEGELNNDHQGLPSEQEETAHSISRLTTAAEPSDVLRIGGQLFTLTLATANSLADLHTANNIRTAQSRGSTTSLSTDDVNTAQSEFLQGDMVTAQAPSDDGLTTHTALHTADSNTSLSSAAVVNQLDNNLFTAQSNLVTAQANLTTARPNLTTARPNLTTARPNLTTARSNLTTARPNLSTANEPMFMATAKERNEPLSTAQPASEHFNAALNVSMHTASDKLGIDERADTMSSLPYYYDRRVSTHNVHALLRAAGDYLLRRDVRDGRPIVCVRGGDMGLRHIRLPQFDPARQGYPTINNRRLVSADEHQWCEYHKQNGIPIKSGVKLMQAINKAP